MQQMLHVSISVAREDRFDLTWGKRHYRRATRKENMNQDRIFFFVSFKNENKENFENKIENQA